MKKTIKNIIFYVYIAIAIVITLLLLAYNDFKVSEFGSYTLLLIKDSSLEPEFNKGDLVIVNKDDKVLTGRKAFFYDTYNQKIEIRLGLVEAAERVTSTETTYTLEGDRKISSEYVLGPANTAEIIPYLGTVLGVLESKWGFLFLIVFPAIILVVNQIGIVFSNIIQATKEEKEEARANNSAKDENVAKSENLAKAEK